jgi:hypothetical protein
MIGNTLFMNGCKTEFMQEHNQTNHEMFGTLIAKHGCGCGFATIRPRATVPQKKMRQLSLKEVLDRKEPKMKLTQKLQSLIESYFKPVTK